MAAIKQTVPSTPSQRSLEAVRISLLYSVFRIHSLPRHKNSDSIALSNSNRLHATLEQVYSQ